MQYMQVYGLIQLRPSHIGSPACNKSTKDVSQITSRIIFTGEHTTIENSKIPLVSCLLNQFIDSRRHTQRLAQFFRNNSQSAISFTWFIIVLTLRTSKNGSFGTGSLIVLLHLLHAQGGQCPAVQRIVPKHVEDGHDTVRLLSQCLEGKFAATPEDALGLGDAHSVNKVSREPKRDHFRYRQDSTLFERYTEINMYHLARIFVEKDIMPVPVSKSKHVSQDGDGGRAPSVGKSLAEPVVGIVVRLHKEESHHRVEVFGDLAECVDSLLERPRLHFGDVLSTYVGLHVLWVVSLMRRHQVVIQRDRVLNEFNYSRVRRQWEHLVCSNAQASLSGSPMILKETAHLLKNLLHYRILSKVIISAFEL